MTDPILKLGPNADDPDVTYHGRVPEPPPRGPNIWQRWRLRRRARRACIAHRQRWVNEAVAAALGTKSPKAAIDAAVLTLIGFYRSWERDPLRQYERLAVGNVLKLWEHSRYLTIGTPDERDQT